MIMTIYFGRQFGTTEPRASIRLDPAIWLEAKGTLGNLRKMLKLSAESDRYFDTMTLPLWEEATEDTMIEAKTGEPIAFAGAEHQHEGRLLAVANWEEEHLRKEEDRFRNAKIHRGKSHAVRMQEIQTRARQMAADEKKRYKAELVRIQKRYARKRELAAAQLEEVRRFMAEVDAA